MWDRLLFRLRSASLDIWPLLGSWKLSVVLMIGTAVFYVMLTAYAFTTPAHVVQNIASLVVFWILYILLLINTATCLWNRIPRLRREISRVPLFGNAIPAREIDLRPDATIGEVEREMRRLGFRPVDAEGVQAFGLRRRWTALGTYLFHGAFFLLAIGFLLSAASRHETKMWAAAGEEFTGSDMQLLSRSAPRPLAMDVAMPSFRVEQIRPEFWQDQLLFTRLEADLTLLPDGEQRVTRINLPLMLSPSRYLRLSGFGYAPRFEIRSPEGVTIQSAFVKMNVFPPGQRDYFRPEGLPYRVYVELSPDAEISDGAVENRSLELARPVILSTVYRGPFMIASEPLKLGESMSFEGIDLRFPEIRYWGELELVHDRGVIWIFLSFALGIAGLLLKLPGRREEIQWVPASDGTGGKLVVRGLDQTSESSP